MTDTTIDHQAELTGDIMFYSQPEPLSKEAHGNLGIRTIEHPYAFTANTNLVPLTVTEFGPAALCYPVIFASDVRTPVAVLGVNPNENLFVDEKNNFQADAYLPAYVRRYPFVLANDQQAQRMIVCIDRQAPMITDDKPELAFFENGELSDYTKGAIEFCNNFEGEVARTMSFVKLLEELDLFERKEARYTPNDGSGESQLVAEYFGVSEEKLNALPAEKLKELQDNGALQQIYFHLLSLMGWERLIVKAMLRPRAPVAANS